jgi:hypothetical protein
MPQPRSNRVGALHVRINNLSLHVFHFQHSGFHVVFFLHIWIWSANQLLPYHYIDVNDQLSTWQGCKQDVASKFASQDRSRPKLHPSSLAGEPYRAYVCLISQSDHNDRTTVTALFVSPK